MLCPLFWSIIYEWTEKKTKQKAKKSDDDIPVKKDKMVIWKATGPMM
jgi:hypothetical protein